MTLLTGTVIPAGTALVPGFCTLSVNVSSPVGGTFQNVVPIGALQTTGGANTISPTAVISIALPAASIPIPTLANWGVVLTAALLLIAGFFGYRRRTAIRSR